MAAGLKPSKEVSGKEIHGCLNTILSRCDAASARLDFPGEGGERPFRGWLVSDLLIDLLCWPAEKVMVGERFDVLLQDSDNFPVITIETKTPHHSTSKKEHADFEARLAGFGTLHTAYITNGDHWERLDISSPTGELEIRDRFALILESSTPEEVEAFFAPLFADRHLRGMPRLSRHSVNRDSIHTLQALASDLDQIVGDLSAYFAVLFVSLRESKAGQQSQDVALALFDLWCEKSLIVGPRQAAEQLTSKSNGHGQTTTEVIKALADMGLTGETAAHAAEVISGLPPQQRKRPEGIAEALWPAYQTAIHSLSVQTAHVFLGRALLYRIGEDQANFPRRLSGEVMEAGLAAAPSPVIERQWPATEMLSSVRLSMQSFLPAVYQLGEFDWWLVTQDKRAAANQSERSWLRQVDSNFEVLAQRLLRILNGYSFGRVDVDVWRNVYQHYLPAEERQRIGGFYTPDELVNLVLDLSEYSSHSSGLCELSFIDPACGSGAFITGALSRLLAHLRLDLPCHTDLHKANIPEWKHAEEALNIISKQLHAIDLHPFAAFLTTLNVLFLLLPLYVRAREKNPDFTLDLQIFSADSLEKPDTDMVQPDMFARLNSRVQLTQESFQRYQRVMQDRFDRVFGNPPWGGVLKGRLAPVYDTAKKQRFSIEFPASAQGKYDVYGLFMERSLQILKSHGRFGLLTQGTFIDKEWAAGLRELLSNKALPRFIVDLNPFGQLFFHAMNSPCITVADVSPDGGDHGHCVAVISMPPGSLKAKGVDERRKLVDKTLRDAIRQVKGHNSVQVGFAHAAKIPRRVLRATAKDRWNLLLSSTPAKNFAGSRSVGDFLEMRQGVTPGGCLDVFLLTEQAARNLELESALVHRAIKSKKIRRWRVDWDGLVLFYPYIVRDREAVPAFTVDPSRLSDNTLASKMRASGLEDALDFDKQLDNRELNLIRQKGINNSSAADLLTHRTALNLVSYPGAAHYLVQHYERLSGRVFEKKRFVDLGKRWYEYHRPRDPSIMLGKRRIVSPTLVKSVRFALDSVGYLSDHACLFLQPKVKGAQEWTGLKRQLGQVLNRAATDEDALAYCLAFLNSDYAQERLTAGHRPTPKGSYAITEEFLTEIPIPDPAGSRTVRRLLEAISQLVRLSEDAKSATLESQVAEAVRDLLT